MRLELHKHRIENVQFGKTTEIQGHTLFINRTELVKALSQDATPLADVVLCRPGEKVRITNILDIVEPRAKAKGRGGEF